MATTRNNGELIAKIIESTNQNEEFSLSKTNALIFVALFVIVAYLIFKHILKKRTNNQILQV